MSASARTIRRSKLGKRKLRLVEKGGWYHGLVDGRNCVDGPNADDVWQRLYDDAGKVDPDYVGYCGARSRFLKFFPNGFHSDGFSAQERDYKLEAKKRLDANAPLTAALGSGGFGEAVLSVFRATNMLSPFEKIRVERMARGQDADAFVQSAAKFALEGTKAALLELERVLKAHDCAKWTVATYLPFLWRPETHMYLKPEATMDFATRVGHPLASLYHARLDVNVYASLLDLVDRTENELSDLAPRDRIDIQSFIWVVGAYTEDGIYP